MDDPLIQKRIEYVESAVKKIEARLDAIEAIQESHTTMLVPLQGEAETVAAVLRPLVQVVRHVAAYHPGDNDIVSGLEKVARALDAG